MKVLLHKRQKKLLSCKKLADVQPPRSSSDVRSNIQTLQMHHASFGTHNEPGHHLDTTCFNFFFLSTTSVVLCARSDRDDYGRPLRRILRYLEKKWRINFISGWKYILVRVSNFTKNSLCGPRYFHGHWRVTKSKRQCFTFREILCYIRPLGIYYHFHAWRSGSNGIWAHKSHSVRWEHVL